MKISTRYFGDVEYSENDVITVPEGIVGFEQIDKYLLMRFADDNQAMFCLQGIGENAPVFIVFNPFEIVDNYEPVLSKADKNDLSCEDKDAVDYYVIANIQQQIEDAVVNLRSPIAINVEKKIAKQIIMDKYDLRHPIFKKTEE